MDTLDLPLDDRLLIPARSVETAMQAEDRRAVRLACTEFLGVASDFCHVSTPPVRVLAARPLRIRGGGSGRLRHRAPSIESAKQLRQADLQNVRDLPGVNGDVDLAALQQADVRAMQVAGFREALLQAS